MISERLEPFIWEVVEARISDIRYKNGDKPWSVQMTEDYSRTGWIIIKWNEGDPHFAYNRQEAREQLRFVETTSVKVILRDDFQTNGAFVRPELWLESHQPSPHDRSEVVEIPVLPRKQKA